MLLLTFCLCTLYTQGYAWRTFNQNFSLQFKNIRKDNANEWSKFHSKADYPREIKFYGNGDKKILFVGDSHMYAYQHRLMTLSDRYDVSIALLTDAGCFVPSGTKFWGNRKQKLQCQKVSKIFHKLIQNKEFNTIVIAQMWGDYYERGLTEATNGLKQMNKEFSPYSQLYVLLDWPWDRKTKQFDPLEHINRLKLDENSFKIQYSKNLSWNFGNKFAMNNISVKNVKFIDVTQYVCPGGLCDASNYRDWHHLRNSYLNLNAHWMDKIFADTLLLNELN